MHMPSRLYRVCTVVLAGLLLGSRALAAQASEPSSYSQNQLKPGVLRVCADPDNLPLSSKTGEGFEIKLAQFIATAWNSKLEVAWWPIRRGFFTRALNGLYCDVAISAPARIDMAATTRPYYRSAYVVVVRKGSGLEDLASLDDPRLKSLRIGVNLLNADAENTPPAMALSAHGVVGTLTGFPTFYSDSTRPEDIINAVANGKVDVAIVWGPIAGYFASRSPTPLVLTPLPDDSLSGIPFVFDIAMATRRRDRALRDSLQTLLDSRRADVQAILAQYHVPTLPLPPDSAAKPAGHR